MSSLTHVVGSAALAVSGDWPAIHPSVFRSPNGIPFLKEPGVVLIAKPQVNIAGLGPFLEKFDPNLRFPEYVSDSIELPPATQLVKAAGQTCYCSWGPGRSTNADAQKYITNILAQKHGSVLEHPNWTFFIYGIGRSVTHELVRHRAGCGFSQVSQRYVDDTTLRFVMRPEYAGDQELEQRFFANIEHAAAEYAKIADILMQRQGAGSAILSGEKKRDERKKRNQAARSVLPNEAEAPITFTANARALRHTLEMRASEHAETEIRRLFMRIYQVIIQVEPTLFGDYQVVALPDGTQCLTTEFVKV